MPTSGVPDSLAAALQDRYTLERELGRGGMATVYLAHDLKHDRPVALKVLHPELAAALGPERFLREIRLTARLQHPHILPIFDSGRVPASAGDAGLLWYTMPYVAGESLRDRLRRERQLPLEAALAIARNVAAALAHAHAHGVVHRDIKPENILLADSEASVADFGIARPIDAAAAAAGGARLTSGGLVVGTAAYMSPEQALGEPQLDGRSDVYALGCVLYEMLAGEPPFAGPTAQAIVARRLAEPLPSLHTIRETVPPSVERAITKALARAPADRFATAAEFAAALEAPAEVAMPPRRRRLRLLGATAMVAAVGGGVAVLVSRDRPPASLDANLVAVAPFEVLDPTLQLWREGMVDVLSRYLDGAGPLRSVSQTAVIKRWTGRADPGTAASLGRRTGAGLVVFGSLVPKVRDSLLLRATVLQVGSGLAEEVEVSGTVDGMGQLADSLGRQILDVLGRHRPIGAVRRASLGASSLPALKAFLRGEQFYRQGRWDSAMAHYARAIGMDSTFALAQERMGVVLWWDPATSSAYEDWQRYARRAERLGARLAPRDSLLITAVARMADLSDDATGPVPLDRYGAAEAALREAVRRYPDDPEGWYFLGELRYHWGPNFGTPYEDQFAPFGRALALDSSFAPAYEHTIQLALALDRPELARRYAGIATTLAAGDPNAATWRLDALLLDPGRSDAPEAARLISAAPAVPLWSAMWDLAAWDDSAESAVRIARSFPAPHRDFTGAPDFVRAPRVQQRVLALLLAKRGHLRDAYATLPDRAAGDWQNPFLELALFGAVPRATADADFRRVAWSDSLWPPWPSLGPRQEQGLAWWLARGDTAALGRFVDRVDSLARSRPPAQAIPYLRSLAAVAEVYRLVLRGDSSTALRTLDSLPDAPCMLMNCFYQKLTHARLLAASGRRREAAVLLDRWLPSGSGPSRTAAVLERGRLAEALGERERAVGAYQRVVNTWRRADPELRPYVDEARQGIVRLTGERR